MDEDKLFWLSFCDGGDGHFLGVVLVTAGDLFEAIAKAWDLGCNPGGEVLSLVAPEPVEVLLPCVREDRMNRLLTREEAEQLDLDMQADYELRHAVMAEA